MIRQCRKATSKGSSFFSEKSTLKVGLGLVSVILPRFASGPRGQSITHIGVPFRFADARCRRADTMQPLYPPRLTMRICTRSLRQCRPSELTPSRTLPGFLWALNLFTTGLLIGAVLAGQVFSLDSSCGWRIVISPIIPYDSPPCYHSSMRHLVVLFIHLIAVLTQLFQPGGVRSLVAESLRLKHQLLIVNRSRQRSPNLSSWDRILAGWMALLIPDPIASLPPGPFRK
jgi:hypothetical protein